MKNAGIVRKIDELGRLVIPKEMRTVLNINNGDPVEISCESGRVVLTKFQQNCCFCGAVEELTEFRGNKICLGCIEEIRRESF